MQALANLYLDTVAIQSASGTDVYGQPILGAPHAAAARVVRKTRTLYMPATGKTLTTAAVVYFRDEVAVSLADRISLPGDASPRTVLLIEQSPDETGREFTKVWIQ